MNRQSQRKFLFFKRCIKKEELYTCSLNENCTPVALNLLITYLIITSCDG